MFRARGQHRSRRSGQRGQTVTEYMMVISVIVIALTAVIYTAFDSKDSQLQRGLNELTAQGGTAPNNIPTKIERGYITQ